MTYNLYHMQIMISYYSSIQYARLYSMHERNNDNYQIILLNAAPSITSNDYQWINFLSYTLFNFIISMSCLISFTYATPTLMITHDRMLTLQDDHNNFNTQMILGMFRQPAARLQVDCTVKNKVHSDTNFGVNSLCEIGTSLVPL